MSSSSYRLTDFASSPIKVSRYDQDKKESKRNHKG